MPSSGPFHGATATRGNNDHLAEYCKDETCPRLPCRMWKAGYDEGYRKGYDDGYAAGYGAGFAAGFAAGFSDGVASATPSG
jgi:hypothetical protein